ncbi:MULTISPECIES: cell division protein CrgA [unclassified Arthrobacter]|uniref:cell division protein CrgA n=1 Tax=unclassified Arthrobacter TaxID=235627 RepID=UPI001D147B6F|nr:MULTISPECIES: cell division protein CrgA [unclassified Arthrobacter]MCC3289601.1 cell division protein CrgA [Arthrobacter sp. zg-Y1110]MCC3300881.1 cell division protein CrgA [Arthrobacter sp. zg-Y895]UWX84971.1 cell division protein CrgA [Arthrobacter sp. zg-Y1110]
MPKSKPRKKAVSKKKQARRAEHEVNALLRGETAYFSDEAEALLTARGWISERDQPGGPDQGDAWYWMPSQLPAYLEEGEPVPTSIYPSSESTFVSQLATPDGSVPVVAQTEYDSLEALEADLDRLQAYRVPDDAWTVLGGGPSAEETPDDLIDSITEEWELIAELIHFPYSNDAGARSFAAVEQAVQDGRLTEYAYRSILAGRAGK